MRLLNTLTGEMKWFGGRKPEYAVLSHTWGKHEQLFQDINSLPRDPLIDERAYTFAMSRTTSRASAIVRTTPLKEGLSRKIRKCCELAAELGYYWIWVDTCCIDKTSSAELAEAITSMYSWYSGAGMCIAYLADVPDDMVDPTAPGSAFRRSRWFRRGWTLQELVAPSIVMLVSQGWTPFGTKATLARTIEEITGIDVAILTFPWKLAEASVADRMRWAAHRQTTRIEDRAYSLQGIFGVAIPILYGEGSAAFQRLQEEIMKLSHDQTLFFWRAVSDAHASSGGLLASSPSDFAGPSTMRLVPIEDVEIPVAVKATIRAIVGNDDIVRRHISAHTILNDASFRWHSSRTFRTVLLHS